MATKVYPSTSRETPSPSYSQLPPENPFSSIHRLSSDSSSSTADPSSDVRSIATAPPPYTLDASAAAFLPTHHLQIETVGKSVLSLPLPQRPDPIPIFSSTDPTTPQFVSLRPSRSSGSCFLVSPSSSSPSPVAGEEDTDLHVPLSTTFYRCGPGRHPRVRLFAPGTATPTANPFTDGAGSTDADGIDLATWDAFELDPVGLLTRAITFRTRLGTFVWRYAGRRERRAMGVESGSVLVLERVVRIALAGGKEVEEVRTPVARLVRTEGLRTAGSSASSAGNGGRLLVDLRLWNEEDEVERDMALVMAVTTCLAMLKKEIDRRRAQQMAVIMGGGGGP